MFKNAAKLSVTRSVGIKLSENMDWRPYAKKDRERKPRETKSVQMEDQRSHKGKDSQNFVGDCNGSEVFIERNQSNGISQGRKFIIGQADRSVETSGCPERRTSFGTIC